MNCSNQRFEITDKNGRLYQADFDQDLWRCTVSDKGIVIGYANGIAAGDALKLADICISNDIPVQSPYWKVWLRSKLGLKPPVIDYRHRGLGSALFRLFLKIAREQNFREVTGDVTHRDLNKLPILLDWYERHGFTVTKVDGDGGVVASASIRITLREDASR